MNNLERLYRQFILDHSKNPRNYGLKGYRNNRYRNPACGDDVTVEVLIADGVIKECNHEGTGCAICCSSASILTEFAKGKTKEELLRLIDKYFKMLIGENIEAEEELEDALVFKTLSNFPARIKCATISWKALEDLIKGEENE